MKKVSLVVTAAVAGLLFVNIPLMANSCHVEHKSGAKAAETKKDAKSTQAAGYTCPMHPEVQSDKPGKCPECKMKLVPVDQKKAEKADNYTVGGDECDTHQAGVAGGHKDHATPQKEVKASVKKAAKKAAIVYICPMHPEVQSDKPGGCPECGMKLEKMKKK